MGYEMLSRITIMAVGVEKYQNMRPLYGPSSDLDRMHKLLVSSLNLSLFKENQFIKLINPSYDEFRRSINTYTMGLSARGDIFVFYFSGHGVALGNSDFGFCVTDSYIHPGSNTILPLTVLKFSDLISSLSVMGVTPVVIIDACYSGAAGSAIISPNDAIGSIHQDIRKSAASNYALLCSCSEYQVSIDSLQGGVFSNLLFDVLSDGIPNSKNGTPSIELREVYKPLVELTEKGVYDAVPRLYIGDTLPSFPLVKNVRYVPQTYSLVGHLHRIIEVLWNEGNPRDLSPSEILELCGKGAYGNHQKLSLEPWRLVENAPNSKKRRLTSAGKLFAEGKLMIPKTIEKDPNTDRWVVASGSVEIDFFSLNEE